MIQRQDNQTDTEAKRLEALNSYNVLDTLPEKEYDAITRLASYICQAPIALITLIDEERQWFKSSIGIDIDQTSRQDAFCNQTILSDEILEIDNAEEDELFKNNPFVTGSAHVRFYAGAPLIDPEGHRLGSLCVIDTVPRSLNEQQRDALRTLASEVMSHLVLRKQKRELERSLEIHKQFSTLFNISPEIHYIAGADSSIEFINDAVTGILGYTPQQAIGRSLWEFVVSKNREQFLPLIEMAVKTGLPFELETQTISSGGEPKWISWCAVHKAGKWYASGRDITYQKQVTQELEQLSLVASSMVNGCSISDANDNVIWTNNAFSNITGYDFNDVQGRRLKDVLVPDVNDTESTRQYNEKIESKKAYSAHVYATRKNGEQVWLSVITSVTYNNNGDVDRYIRIISDITSRKTTQHDLEILSFAAHKSPAGMLTRDAEGHVLWMNEAVEKITGYTLSEMKGKKFGTTLLGPDTDMSVFQGAFEAFNQGRPYDIEILIYRKDGAPRWVNLSNNPLKNDKGVIERQVGAVIDITERKHAENELKLLSLVASSINSGVVINNSKGEIEWVNPAFEKITGYSFKDVTKKHLGDVIQGELTDTFIIQNARELSKNKKSFEVDLLAYRKDRKPMWISVINSVILNKSGEVEKYIEVIIDISAKKKVELELITAKEEALQLSRAKDMFISVMTHEIRTPLNAVIGMSHLLQEANPDPAQKENLDILKFSAENLMLLINDVLDFTKIETGNIQLEKASVDLRDLVQGITGSMHFKTQEKSIQLIQKIDEQIPGNIIGDRTRLAQILLNLVSNAVKFTDAGSITVELKVIEQNNNDVRIRFAVADTGIGIANNKLNTIFESFKQAEADTTRKYGGTGLGLAISKRLIELHDSRINVESTLGKGSNFWFTVTFKKANGAENNNINVESGLNINVLVVDDNQINRLLINKILTKWGATVDFAENGLQAVNKVETNNNYDVVLMDIHMPEMGGLEATQVIRSKPDAYFKQLPIIALTASMLTNQMSQIGDAGMNDYILKPFEPKALFEKLSRYQKS
ncbi:PAS domain-containing protein [Mucilaginibacter auburnensis]|uniref:histidine kinase n=1 Tax=Mucilaginibacter auburnensis TaxID=1457233 RepID=A0A2H9VST1_9SPHI|nr:PAS domain-containing protein [Mucilaginibacter auburnensis]PJJ83874.1 PAS domain S-box-containing protein [Mucilaginibacter auburnensis]